MTCGMQCDVAIWAGICKGRWPYGHVGCKGMLPNGCVVVRGGGLTDMCAVS